jgi:hypothetical protein
MTYIKTFILFFVGIFFMIPISLKATSTPDYSTQLATAETSLTDIPIVGWLLIIATTTAFAAFTSDAIWNILSTQKQKK